MLAVALGEGGGVGDGSFYWAGGEGGVGDGALGGAGLEVFDVVPADGFAVFGFGVAGEADAGEAFAVGEDDAAVLVIPGVGLVLAHDGELDAVDGLELFEGEAEFAGDEDVELDQRPAAGEVAAQGAIPPPLGRQLPEKVRVEARIVAIPALGAEALVPTFRPELGVVRGEAVEGEGAACHERGCRTGCSNKGKLPHECCVGMRHTSSLDLEVYGQRKSHCRPKNHLSNVAKRVAK